MCRLRHTGTTLSARPAVVALPSPSATYRRRMHAHQDPSLRCDPARVQYLHLVAAARVSALPPADPQQIVDIVRVTVDDEVDTGTFSAIVSDVTDETRRRRRQPPPSDRLRPTT
jgi:hypothetical protein